MMTMMTINNTSSSGSNEDSSSTLEKDYYGCFCLKFIVKNGTHITEEKVISINVDIHGILNICPTYTKFLQCILHFFCGVGGGFLHWTRSDILAGVMLPG